MAFAVAPPTSHRGGWVGVASASASSTSAQQKAALSASALAIWAARGVPLLGRPLRTMHAQRSNEVTSALRESASGKEAAQALRRLRSALPRSPQAQRDLVEVLAELVVRVELDSSTLVSALIPAANAHAAFTRSAAPAELLERFHQASKLRARVCLWVLCLDKV
ncbi:unnamed protein product [Symbiodinium natans]|uniref:Uncharacterized protein n=1 Tax=Symbiodinium natans TaxID=878477 RepID=A0A812RRQ7_9DINO|nr:unnamed protein product [Symbiodinium natans]